MKFILGKKLNMTQIFRENGDAVAVTAIQAGPCQITQVKSVAKDGYRGAQLGYGSRNRLTKALLGHLKNLPKFRYLKEFPFDEKQELIVGQTVTVNSFAEGEMVRLTAASKGKGFQGVVKRHGFHGSPASHGHKDQLRMPGSIGSTGPQRVLKGVRMAGRMGGDTTTINLEIVKIDFEKNLLYVKGAAPGARNGLVMIQAKGELKQEAEPAVATFTEEALAPVEEVKTEEVSATGGSASGGKEEAKLEEVAVKTSTEEVKENS